MSWWLWTLIILFGGFVLCGIMAWIHMVIGEVVYKRVDSKFGSVFGRKTWYYHVAIAFAFTPIMIAIPILGWYSIIKGWFKKDEKHE